MLFKSTSRLGYLKMYVCSSDTLSTSVVRVVEFYIVAGEILGTFTIPEDLRVLISGHP